MEEGSEDLSNECPSFSSYASNGFAVIAAKASQDYKYGDESSGGPSGAGTSEAYYNEDDDFEFSTVRADPGTSAGEIDYDNQVRPVFPVFNRGLLVQEVGESEINTPSDDGVQSLFVPLKELFLQDELQGLVNKPGPAPPSSPSSSSISSEANELVNIPQRTYSIWRPDMVESSPSRCKKSHSTGSTSFKLWKFRDLLCRSNSEGNNSKKSFVLLTPRDNSNPRDKLRHDSDKSTEKEAHAAGKLKLNGRGMAGKAMSSASSAHEAFYVRNRAIKEGDRRKSYLPYRQDLVGLFANVQPLGRSFPPFF